MANPQITDGQKAKYHVSELDPAKQGATPKPGDTASIVSSDPNSLSVVPNSTPDAGDIATGFIVGGTPKAGVTVTFSGLRSDGTPMLKDDGTPFAAVVDVYDVISSTASALAVSIEEPIPQGVTPPI